MYIPLPSGYPDRTRLLQQENPVLQCEWRPPEDVPAETPPVELPPGMPEEEPFIPEPEPPPSPLEVPRNKWPVTDTGRARINTINRENNHHVRGKS